MTKRNFKGYISLILSVMLIMSTLVLPLGVGATSDVVTLLDEKFESYDEGTDVSTLADWGEGTAKNNIDKTVVTDESDTNTTKMMCLAVNANADPSASKFYKNITTANSGGVYVFSFDAKLNDVRAKYGFNIQLNKAANSGKSSTGQIVLRNKFNEADNISFKDATVTTNYAEKTAEGTWYNYKIVYNSITKNIALYLDGVDVLPFEVLGGSSAPLVDSIGSVSFIMARDNYADNSAYFDNLLLTVQNATKYDADNTLPATIEYAGADFVLPTIGLTGSTITWASSNPDVISDAGVVTQPTANDAVVTLTATVSDGTSADTVVAYDVTIPKVPSAEEPDVEDPDVEESSIVTLLDEKFEDYALDTDVATEIEDWGEGTANNNIDKKVVAVEGDSNATQMMSLAVNDIEGASASKFYRNITTENTGGVYVFSYDAKINNIKAKYGFTVQLNKTAEQGKDATGLILLRNKFNAADNISFKNATANYAEKTEKETWYNYKIVYNSINKNIALYLDGELVLPFEPITGNSALVDSIGSVSFNLDRNNKINDSVYFDNLLLTVQNATEYDADNTLPETIVYIEDNLVLPTKGLTGSTITWASSNEAVISNTGVVTPSAEGEKVVTLTATVSDGTSADTVVTYDVTVPKLPSQEEFDAKNLDKDYEALELPLYSGQTQISLPKAGANGSTITWETTDASVIDTEGNITPSNENKTVTLTATVTNGSAEAKTKTFKYLIYKKGTLLFEDFSTPEVDEGENGYSINTNGFNGWSVPGLALATKVIDTDFLVKDDALVIKQGVETDGEDLHVTKSFSSANGGTAVLSLDVDLADSNLKDSGGGFNVIVGGLVLQFRPMILRVKPVDGSWTDWSYFDVPSDKKYNLKIALNLDAKKADVSVNGTVCISGYDITDCSRIVNNIDIYPIRVQGREDESLGSKIIIDNILISHIAPKAVVSNITFADKDGDVVTGLVDGGKIKGVTVSANEDLASAWVHAGVYTSDGRKLTSIATAKLTDLKKGEANVVTFEKQAQLPETGAIDAVVKVYVFSDGNLVPLTSAPLVYTKDSVEKIKFIMCGDSMTCNYSATTSLKVGVGMAIGNYFDSTKVGVLNIGSSGASTKTFYEEKQKLQENIDAINNGDYVFLMFGHNDSSNSAKGTTPEEFKSYLTKMIDLAKSKGAIPVLLSPIVRYIWNDDGVTLNNDSLKVYTDAMAEYAQEFNVKYIDVNAATKALIEGYGKDSEQAEAFYIMLKETEAGLDDRTTPDTTHMTRFGAETVASIIAAKINENGWLPEGYYIGQ
ncbi:MAG: hypothetical protein II978_06815 [Clostridia bacterium]|nr:hypothetical protein [Clostridia bacterium]